MISYTRFPHVTDIYSPQDVTQSWEDFVAAFSEHEEMEEKDDAGVFGPYTLKVPEKPCKHRPGVEHRCDHSVAQITLAVFDADQGTEDDMGMCLLRLNAAGFAYMAVSSHSYPLNKEGKVPYRIIVPLETPLDKYSWKSFREELIKTYGIPADLAKCSGWSHLYFLPTCRPGADRDVYVASGHLLDPTTVPHTTDRKELLVEAAMTDWKAVEQEEGPVDLTEIRRKLLNEAGGLVRRKNPMDVQKGEWLQRCLRGEAIAEHGSRDEATMRVAGMLAWRLPDLSHKAIFAIMVESVRAMQAAGSRKVTDASVLRKIESAQYDYAAKVERERVEKEDLLSMFKGNGAAITQVPTRRQ